MIIPVWTSLDINLIDFCPLVSALHEFAPNDEELAFETRRISVEPQLVQVLVPWSTAVMAPSNDG